MSKEIIEIETLKAGQPRPYADSVYEATISVRVEGMLLNRVVFYRNLDERIVKGITRLFVGNFVDEPNMFDARLEVCKPIGPSEEMKEIAKNPNWLPKENSRWLVKIIVPFDD